MGTERTIRPWTVVEYTACPDCSCKSLGLQADSRIVRHSRGFGSVEKVGPGTRHPLFRTTICTGSGKKERLMGKYTIQGAKTK